MPELGQICDKIERQISAIREKAGERAWANFSRPAFVNNVSGIISQLDELYSLFQIARTEADKNPQASRQDIAAHISDMGQLITVLKRNRQMEEERLDKLRTEGINSIAETVTVPALYSDLEQKVLSMLLKSTYAAERLRVSLRKREPGMQARGAQKNILDLLEKKENELEDLRKKD